MDQINIYGRNMVEQAIYRLQLFEQPDGYFLAFSGGKDSVTIKALADLAGVKYTAHYSVTSVDPPELVQFVKTFPDVAFDIPRDKDGNAVTMWNLIPIKALPPTRLVRYCCAHLKEHMGTGPGVIKLTGVRWSESVNRRKNRGGLEISESQSARRALYNPDEIPAEKVPELLAGAFETILNPIVDWTDEDVWQFIRENGVRYCELYDEGFKRLGCVGCPMGGPKAQEKGFERWPKYKDNYMAAFARMIENNKARAKEKGAPYIGPKDAEAVMNWWLRKSAENDKREVEPWNRTDL